LQRRKRPERAQPRAKRGDRLRPPLDRAARPRDARVPEIAQKSKRDMEVLGAHPGEARCPLGEIARHRSQVLSPLPGVQERAEASDHSPAAPTWRRTRSSAVNAARDTPSARVPPKRNRSTLAPPSNASPRNARPTGFSGVPPSGPAIPVVETPI